MILAPRRRAPWFLPALGLVTVIAVNLPLLYLFVRASEAGPRLYLRSVLAGSSVRLLADTLLLVVGVVPLALLLGLPMAWLVARTDLRGRRLWAVACALPLVFPSYVSSFSVVAVLGPRGFVQGWLEPLGIERLPPLAQGYTGALLALALCTYPYVYLPVLGALRDLDPALEESSRTLGAGRWTTLGRVVLPQLRLPICAGVLLVVLYTLSDFGAVSIVRYNTLTVGIYNAYVGLFDRNVAACLATLLVGLTLLSVGLQSLLLRGARPTRSRPSRPCPPVPLGGWTFPSLAALVVVSLFSLGIPVGVSVYWGVRAVVVGNPLGTAGSAAVNSLLASSVAALAAVALAVPVATWAVRYPGWWSRSTERLTYAGHALPGLVVALALVFLATRHVGALYQTLGLLVAAYVIRFLPEAIAPIHGALSAVSPSFEEAGRSLGRGPFEVLRTLTLPLIRPGFLAGAGLVFLTSMKELPATLILRPIGFETLATRIWTAASEGIYSQAALPTLSLLLASAAPAYLLFLRPLLAERPAP